MQFYAVTRPIYQGRHLADGLVTPYDIPVGSFLAIDPLIGDWWAITTSGFKRIEVSDRLCPLPIPSDCVKLVEVNDA